MGRFRPLVALLVAFTACAVESDPVGPDADPFAPDADPFAPDAGGVNCGALPDTSPSWLVSYQDEIVARLKRPGEFVLEWAASPDGAKRGGLYQTGNFAAPAEACEIWMRGRRI